MHRRIISKLLLVFLLSVLSAQPLWANGNEGENEEGLGGIKGKVTTTDNRPAAMVNVALKDTKKNTITSDDGYYSIHNIKPGDYQLEVSLVGYETITQDVTIEANKTIVVNLQLQVSEKELQEVIITTHRNIYKANKVSPSLRILTPILETPQNIQIITNSSLADQQIISMSDGVIKNVSGATRLEHWADLYTRVNARGSRLAAFRNGVNITSNWGPLNEDMSFVDHIEFVKGPAGFMMSNGEPSGIYNVVTKKPTGRDFNGEATFTLGSFDLYRTTLDLDGKLNKSGKLLYRFNVMGQTKNSFRDYEYNNRYSIAPVISYKMDDKTTLTLEYTYQHANMSDVGSAYVFAPDGYAKVPRNFTIMIPGLEPTRIDDHSAFLNLQHHFNDNWKLTAQAAYFNYRQTGSSMWPTLVDKDGNIIRNVGIWDAAAQFKFGQLFVNGDVHTGSIRHRILGGLDVGTKAYIADWNQTFDLDSAGAYFNIYHPVYTKPVNGLPQFDRSKSLPERGSGNNIDQSYSGLYLQDELSFFDNIIRLTLAGRYTYVKEASYGSAKQEDRKLTPRVGLSVSIDRQTAAYGLYDQSFVPQSGILRSGKKPKPITGNNIEFGLKRDWFGGKWNTSVAVYRIIKNNELTADPSNTGSEQYSIELGQSKAQGIEFDMRGEILQGFNLIANYALTDSKVTKAIEDGGTIIPAGTPVAGYAKHEANAWLNYEIQSGTFKRFGLSGGFSWQADRSTWTWDKDGEAKLPDYFRVDGGVFWSKDKIKITANVFNILDKYLYSGSYYGYGNYYYWQAEAPRNVRLSVAYRFN